LRVTVCQLTNDAGALEEEWAALGEHVRSELSDFVLLPEMPFYRWLAASADPQPAGWIEAVHAHEAWCRRLHQLDALTVAASRPVTDGDHNYNEGFVWESKPGELTAVHRKRYLPKEDGFWEASWYSPGPGSFLPAGTAQARVGFLICSELWFSRHARDYGKQGVQLLLSPRATLASTTDKWIAGGRVAAVASGAYSLSSNFAGDAGGAGTWGGAGWIIEPEEGDVLGVTSNEVPFLTLEIELGLADAAKSTYPRYILD